MLIIGGVSMDNYSVGKRIKDLRAELKISQEQLALRANITPAYLGQIEREEKNPTVKVIEKISNILGISLSEFFSYASDKNLNEKNYTREHDKDYIRQITFEMRNLSDSEKNDLLKLVKSIIKFKNSK